MSSQFAPFNITGRRAVVTGAAGGLGRCFALALAGAGAHVLSVDYDAAGLDEILAQGQVEKLNLATLVADVSSETEVAGIQAWVGEKWGGSVDILVNNAGIATLPGRLHEVSVADWDRAIAVNLRSQFLVTRALLSGMMARKSGSIINLSSFLGLVGLYPGFAITAIPYAASKAGIIGFTRQLAIEYAGEGIRVNAIAPGWHGGTNLGRELKAAARPEDLARFEKFIKDSVPMGHRGKPEDLIGLLLYLASDASGYMTGQVFAHDGGITAA